MKLAAFLCTVFCFSVFYTVPAGAAYSDNANAAQECADQGQDYASAVTFVQKLQKIISAKDASSFAQLVAYPVTVNGGKTITHSVKIKSSKTLASHYNQLMTASMQRSILNDPDIECTEEGVMIDAGAIWFTTEGNTPKITAINVQSN